MYITVSFQRIDDDKGSPQKDKENRSGNFDAIRSAQFSTGVFPAHDQRRQDNHHVYEKIGPHKG